MAASRQFTPAVSLYRPRVAGALKEDWNLFERRLFPLFAAFGVFHNSEFPEMYSKQRAIWLRRNFDGAGLVGPEEQPNADGRGLEVDDPAEGSLPVIQRVLE